MNILTRADALAQGLKRYYTGQPCKKGHTSERLVVDHSCYECKKARSRKDMREAYQSDPNAAGKKAAYRESNPELHRAANKRYAEANPEVIAECRHRRRSSLQETAAELTPDQKAQVKALYIERDRLNREAGCIAFHVDHIKPVAKGGAHHPDNLQILPAEENLRKSDKY